MGSPLKSGSVAALAVLFAMSLSSALAQDGGKAYEQRVYTANAGKLADFQTVFRSKALPLFSKYGIEKVFDGTVLEAARSDGADGPNMLVCIFAFPNAAAAGKAWASLEGDATWQAALKQAEAGGALLAKPAVSIVMSPTDFSPAFEGLLLVRQTGVLRRRCLSCGSTIPGRPVCRIRLISLSQVWRRFW